jgi:hypothetical protein
MRLLPAAAALSLLAMSPVAHAADASTTRIETRPYYGAAVTVESGVRVFRPLPPHRNVIIAPTDGPPVNVSVGQTDKRTVIEDARPYEYRLRRD